MPRQILKTFVVIAVLTAWFALTPDAESRFNLPQVDKTAVITGDDHQALKEFFAHPRRQSTTPLNEKVEHVLWRYLPEIVRTGCDAMVSQWGSGTADSRISVRLLHTEKGKEGKFLHAFLAYRCSSASQQYARYGDERLAVLTVDARASQLSLLQNEQDCSDCSDVTSVTVERVLSLFGKTVIGVSFARSTDNPCCDGPHTFQEKKMGFYVIKDTGVRHAGSVLTRRVENSHDDAEGDIVTAYDAGLVFKKDMKGNIIGILSPYTLKENRKLKKKGLIQYLWSQEREEFIKE